MADPHDSAPTPPAPSRRPLLLSLAFLCLASLAFLGIQVYAEGWTTALHDVLHGRTIATLPVMMMAVVFWAPLESRRGDLTHEAGPDDSVGMTERVNRLDAAATIALVVVGVVAVAAVPPRLTAPVAVAAICAHLLRMFAVWMVKRPGRRIPYPLRRRRPD